MKSENKDLIKSSLKMLEVKDFELINNYFSNEYKQNVNGKNLGFADFRAHISHLYEVTESIKVEIQQLLEENNVVFSRHKVTSVMKNGDEATFLVFAEFEIVNNKIQSCIELTHLLDGDKDHSTLGSDV
jgi:predicted SnoaL-like aldol condensation-catalyzing enzyme